MPKINVAKGLRFAFVGAAAHFLVATVSYATACMFYRNVDCSFAVWWKWLWNHPVFAPMFPFVIGAWFIAGAFVVPFPSFAEPLKSILAWIVVLLLIAAFILWGIPELPL